MKVEGHSAFSHDGGEFRGMLEHIEAWSAQKSKSQKPVEILELVRYKKRTLTL